jgi:hypothetical protein
MSARSSIGEKGNKTASTPWVLTNDATQRSLERVFERDRIDFGSAGFCDSTEFLMQEQRDPRYLELYARYVESRNYDAGYLAEARRKIAVVTEAVRASVEIDGRLGACVDASGIIGRMLDRLGVWNYVAKATLTIEFPRALALSSSYFWAIDHGEFTAPHAIVVAPPYYIVDATVRYQAYDARRASLIPNMVLADHFVPDRWRPEDIANPELINALKQHRVKFSDFIAREFPGMGELLSQLPSRKFVLDGTSLRYAIVAIGGAIEPLDKITGYKPSGRAAQAIFDDDVLPMLASSDELVTLVAPST